MKLQRVILALEQDNPKAYTAAMESLLTGPLVCSPALATESSLLRAELLQFLRSAVAAADSDRLSYSPIQTSRNAFSFRTLTVDGRVVVAVNGQEARDLVILQVITLLQLVGLKNIRICRLPECRRMFVKTYRREFCSPQHQGLHNKRQQRQNRKDREEREHRRAARRES